MAGMEIGLKSWATQLIKDVYVPGQKYWDTKVISVDSTGFEGFKFNLSRYKDDPMWL